MREQLYVLFGLVLGAAFSCAFMPAISVTTQWFSEKRRFEASYSASIQTRVIGCTNALIVDDNDNDDDGDACIFRGLAMGIAVAGSGVGTLVIPPLLDLYIESVRAGPTVRGPTFD